METVTLALALPNVPLTLGERLKGIVPEGSKIVIESDQTCVVIAKTADGEYRKLSAAKESDGIYVFDVSGIEGGFTVALKGDTNLDGEVGMTDATDVMLSWVNGKALGGIKDLVAETDGEGGISMADATAIMLSWVNKRPLDWDLK